MVPVIGSHSSALPTVEDARLSAQSSRILAQSRLSDRSSQRIKVIAEDGSERDAVIPALAFNLLIEILTQISQGNAVTIAPIQSELTTQEAADLLNVSRPYLIKLIDRGDIPCRKVGKHRRVSFSDLMLYKERNYRLRSAALDELASLSQELEMGY